MDYGSFEAAVKRSQQLEADLSLHPERYRVLTGDRPTGRLHIGHLFGSLTKPGQITTLGSAILYRDCRLPGAHRS